MKQEEGLRRSPLFPCHQEAGARLVDFAGWEMPVQYAGLMAEHEAVRTAAGLFDVSHMGEFRVSGPGAEAFLQRMTPNNVAKLKIGRAHYSALLTQRGTYVDDLLIYRLGQEEFLVVVNAANIDKDFDWLSSHLTEDCQLENQSDDFALIALQGPKAPEILAKLTDVDLNPIRYYRFKWGDVAGVHALISRTGYTGEDGFELYVPPSQSPNVWRSLMEVGAPLGLQPAGLGARDTLRLEASMALYGHEIDDTTTPWEAGLDWTVKMASGDFLGRDALLEQQQRGADRRLVGFEIEGRGIAREGHLVLLGDQEVGRVTSGTYSPTFKKALGMAYVPLNLSEPGQPLVLDVRGKRLEAKVAETPFYRREK
ncbi:MAG: glycine cleavage system aminomethyltransferase GcvT [Deltaproteobacteria bacterium]|nr:glycine cleavage system aminomethyltransferase GcvT [Deltaproteobacteria bacterium]